MMVFINLERYQSDKLFSKISSTLDYLSVELYLAEYFQYWNGNPTDKIIPYACINDDKQKRAFIVGQDKIISFAFYLPIKVIQSESLNYLTFNFWGKELSSIHFSQVRTILNSMRKHDYLYVANDIEEDGIDAFEVVSYKLLEHLLKTEPSYLRVDHDTLNLATPNHPIDHIDVNYSSFSSFKIGLDNRIDFDELCNIIDKDTACRVLR